MLIEGNGFLKMLITSFHLAKSMLSVDTNTALQLNLEIK